ncbi:hypothetical protein [Faecalicatena faecalis]|uniref:hypothetical protein n=1 Tax=Faecalicatena faecalis TaxID=2726362 RepID=UPI001C0AE87F|nr:hypothetical protein [Faecalicatena faecalis]
MNGFSTGGDDYIVERFSLVEQISNIRFAPVNGAIILVMNTTNFVLYLVNKILLIYTN